jgi:hypothetical protein
MKYLTLIVLLAISTGSFAKEQPSHRRTEAKRAALAHKNHAILPVPRTTRSPANTTSK